jgi:hypothetical protein
MDLGGNHFKRSKFQNLKKQIQEPIWFNPYLNYDDQNVKTFLKKKKKKKTFLAKETESEASIPEARGLVGRSKRYA